MAFNLKGQWVSPTAKVDQRGRPTLSGPTLDAFGVEIFGLITTFTLVLGQAAETESSFPLSIREEKTLGLATETDSSAATAWRHEKVLGQAIEDDTALPAILSTPFVAAALGLAAEAETGLALSISRIKPVGLSSESDQGFALSMFEHLNLGMSVEADSVMAIMTAKGKVLLFATETDSGMALSIVETEFLGRAVESDSGIPIFAARVKTTGQAQEVDSGFSVDFVRAIIAGLALETDTAFMVEDMFTTPVGVVLVHRLPFYRVVIADLGGVPIEEVPANLLNYGFVLNDSGKCSFELPLDHPKCVRSLLDPGKREVHIYREGDFTWGGYLLAAGAGSDNDTVRFSGSDWLWRFTRRHIDESIEYEDMDQLDIAWDIIQTASQHPKEKLHVTRFDPGESSGENLNLKLRGNERFPVMDTVRSLAEDHTGFDFNITPDKQWRTYYPLRGIDSDLVFELGKNITYIEYDISAEDMVTELSGLGPGSGRSRCIAVVIDNDLVDEYGLLQSSEDFSEIRTYARLETKTEAWLNMFKKPLWQPKVAATISDPEWGSYELGDRLFVVAQKGYIDIDRRFRLIGIDVQVSDEGVESQDLYFDEASAGV